MSTSLRGPRAWLVVACGLALTMSCSSGEPSRPSSGTVPLEEPAPQPRVGTAADLRGTKDASVAYQATADGLASDAATFESKVGDRGELQITPRIVAPLAPPGSPLTLETSLVSRGATLLASGRSKVSLAQDGSVLVPRGTVTEHVENDGTGVEQSWLFARAPEGEGNLVVRVRATGQSYQASTDHGLHFASADGGLGLRYGTATWIDADGKRTVVAPRFANGEIVMVVPDAVIASSRYPAVLDPTVTAEKEIDTPVLSPNGLAAIGAQQTPSITALPGGGYLAVWADRRGARPAFYAARLKSDGSVQDNTGIPLVQGVGQYGSNPAPPVVAAGPGGGFLVAWTVTTGNQYQTPGLYAVRLDASLKVLDPAPVVLATGQTQPQYLTAAANATNYLVVWQHNNGTPTYNDIAAVRIGPTGPVLDATPIDVSKLTEYEYQPTVRSDGTNFLVAWRGNSAVYTRGVADDGSLIGGGATAIYGTPGVYGNYSLYDVSLSWDATSSQYLLAWWQYTYSGSTYYDVFAKRVTAAGAAVDANPIAIAADSNFDQYPRAVADANGWVVYFSRSSTLMASRVTRAGVADATPTSIATSTYSGVYDHAAASDGAGSVDVYTDDNPSSLLGYNVKGVHLGTTVAAATPFIVSRSVNTEAEPSTAWNGTTYFSVWLDTRDNRGAIYGAPIDANGTPGTAVKVLSDPIYNGDFQRPRIASDGTNFLVVFIAVANGQRVVRGMRIDAAGVVTADGVFDIWVPVSEQNADISVAFDGTNYLVVFQQQNYTTYPYPTGIGAVRVPKTGTTVLDKQPIRITPLSGTETRAAPTVAFDGQNYFVAWSLARPTGATNFPVSHIYGTRVSKEGAVLEGEQVLCDAFLLQSSPFVTADPKKGGFFVVWEDYRTALDTADVYGARINAQGQNLDGTGGLRIAAGAYDESRPRAAPAGDDLNWIVAWRDFRSKTTYDLYGSWINEATAKVLDPTGYQLSAEAGDEDAPWLDSAAGNKKTLLTYQRLDPQPSYGSFRVRTRMLESGLGVAQGCAANDDCASRSCVDGVCCSTDCGGCGVCNEQPGTCTPKPAGSESAACGTYKCKGALDCPSTCDTDADCTGTATCDPATHTCVSRIICTDDHTLKDLTGALKDCGPYKCIGDACRTQCGSVDDCAGGFVCDPAGRCVKAPGGDTGGCAVGGTSSGPGLILVGLAWMAASIVARRRRR
jgi:hypothetical protein